MIKSLSLETASCHTGSSVAQGSSVIKSHGSAGQWVGQILNLDIREETGFRTQEQIQQLI